MIIDSFDNKSKAKINPKVEGEKEYSVFNTKNIPNQQPNLYCTTFVVQYIFTASLFQAQK